MSDHVGNLTYISVTDKYCTVPVFLVDFLLIDNVLVNKYFINRDPSCLVAKGSYSDVFVLGQFSVMHLKR